MSFWIFCLSRPRLVFTLDQAAFDLRLVVHNSRKATLKLCTYLDTKKEKKRKKKPREKRRTLEPQLQLSLIAVSQASTYFITNTVCRATRSSGCDPQTFHCLRVCLSRAWLVLFCCCFFVFSHCLFLTNLQAQGCIAHHGSIHSRLAHRERHVQLQTSRRYQATRQAVQDRAAQGRRKEAEAQYRGLFTIFLSYMPALQY